MSTKKQKQKQPEFYIDMLTRYELQPKTKQIEWLAKNNDVIYIGKHFLGIKNVKYEGVYTFFLKRNNVSSYYDLRYYETDAIRAIERTFNDTKRINEDEDKTVKRFHFHLDNPSLQDSFNY